MAPAAVVNWMAKTIRELQGDVLRLKACCQLHHSEKGLSGTPISIFDALLLPEKGKEKEDFELKPKPGKKKQVRFSLPVTLRVLEGPQSYQEKHEHEKPETHFGDCRKDEKREHEKPKKHFCDYRKHEKRENHEKNEKQEHGNNEHEKSEERLGDFQKHGKQEKHGKHEKHQWNLDAPVFVPASASTQLSGDAVGEVCTELCEDTFENLDVAEGLPRGFPEPDTLLVDPHADEEYAAPGSEAQPVQTCCSCGERAHLCRRGRFSVVDVDDEGRLVIEKSSITDDKWLEVPLCKKEVLNELAEEAGGILCDNPANEADRITVGNLVTMPGNAPDYRRGQVILIQDRGSGGGRPDDLVYVVCLTDGNEVHADRSEIVKKKFANESG